MQIVQGDRIGKTGDIKVDSTAVIFDPDGQKILLTQRSDNGRWCLPGGHMEAGESVEETCIREVMEETGLQVQVQRLIGIYSSPHVLLEYPDGRRQQIVGLAFAALPIGGKLQLTESTQSFGYFSRAEAEGMDILEHHRPRIMDAFAGQTATFVR